MSPFRPRLRTLYIFGALIHLALVGAAVAHVNAHPAWNLDGIFYAALIESGPPMSAYQHAALYAQIERETPAAAATALEHGSRYRTLLRTSPEVFGLQLRFYVGRPLYIWSGVLLKRLFGRSSVQAPFLVSTASLAAVAVLLSLLAARAGARPIAASAVGALGVWLPSINEVCGLATPDALSTALLLAGVLMAFNSPRCAVVPLFGAVLTRPDAALISVAIVLAISTGAKPRLRALEALAVALALALLALLTVHLSEAHSWPIVMRHTFIDRVVDASSLDRTFSGKAYLKALGLGIHGHMTDHPAGLLPYLVLAALTAGARASRRWATSPLPIARMLACVWGATLMRFLFMPILADRFFAPAYACSIALACAVFVPRKEKVDNQQPMIAGHARDNARV